MSATVGITLATHRARWKRERAFNLLRLEAAFATDEEMERLHIADGRRVDRRRMIVSNGATSEDKCQAHCNDELRSGLDMVKAHTSFGSIGVPSVIDKFDLHLFCRLDTEHDRCLRSCGFEIQFNMRDYICRDRYKEMVSNLWCYARAAPVLKRQCGATRCGPYAELETTLAGWSSRGVAAQFQGDSQPDFCSTIREFRYG
ncbi:Protein M05D6.9 [Aphelenchoides avenae]|nr:Protein M05D6.9 [Aphelenchus avenae]